MWLMQKGGPLLDSTLKAAGQEQPSRRSLDRLSSRPLASPLGHERKTIPANWPDQGAECADPGACPIAAMPSPRRRLASTLSMRMKNLLWSKDNAVRMKGR